MRTKAMFPGHYSEFDGEGDDAVFDGSVLIEVVEVKDGEIEIAFTADSYREYVTFRLKDLLRAVKEFNA